MFNAQSVEKLWNLLDNICDCQNIIFFNRIYKILTWKIHLMGFVDELQHFINFFSRDYNFLIIFFHHQFCSRRVLMELSDSLTTAKNLAVSRRLAKISRNVTLAVKAITPLRLSFRGSCFSLFQRTLTSAPVSTKLLLYSSFTNFFRLEMKAHLSYLLL